MHTDFEPHEGSDAIVASALAHSVPVVTAKQMLDWVDGRNASSFRNVGWNGNTLGFTIDVGAGANGLQAMLPRQAGGKTLDRAQPGWERSQLHEPDDQGHRVRGLHGSGRLVRGDVRALARPAEPTRRGSTPPPGRSSFSGLQPGLRPF